MVNKDGRDRLLLAADRSAAQWAMMPGGNRPELRPAREESNRRLSGMMPEGVGRGEEYFGNHYHLAEIKEI